MSLTSSSGEAGQTTGSSSTEALASRYRRLFVLPSTVALLFLVTAAAAVFDFLIVGSVPTLQAFAASLVPTVLAAFLISKGTNSVDVTSIATFRRSLAAVFSGQVLWLACLAAGSAYSLFHPDGRALGNSLVFGAFLCAGFEVMVVNGAFIRRAFPSLFLGAVHPVLAAVLLVPLTGASFGVYAVVPGAITSAAIASFPWFLKRKRTSQGYDAVTMFQAFMKTWADNDASGLESIISAHAKTKRVSSKVFRFDDGGDDVFLILPGVHPGPFYPVGSYDLPGLLFHSFRGVGNILVLHRPGGHESNLATNADAKRYSDEIRAFAAGMQPGSREARVRGPLVTKVGRATAAAVAFDNDVLLTVSFAPYGSDDLETEAESELAEVARREGYEVAVVDAHNSIEAKREALDPRSQEWELLMRRLKGLPAEEFRIGYAHSSEAGFAASGDITENGISVAVMETNGVDWVLALADANNAVPLLREEAARALEAAGYRLLELCTSDSHDLAARGLTVERGYHALGEVTPVDSISRLIVSLADTAKSRLKSRSYCSGSLVSEVSVLGVDALNEFAELTQSSSRLARAYAAFAVVSTAVLLVSSLIM